MALDPNPPSGRDEVTHPHVHAGTLCPGDAAERHARATGRADARGQLGTTALVLNVVAWVWTLATVGVGFLIGGVILGVAATWLVQAELNAYADSALDPGPAELDD